MYSELDIKLPNGMEVILWRAGEETCVGVVNDEGFVLSDRKLSREEVEKLSSMTKKL